MALPATRSEDQEWSELSMELRLADCLQIVATGGVLKPPGCNNRRQISQKILFFTIQHREITFSQGQTGITIVVGSRQEENWPKPSKSFAQLQWTAYINFCWQSYSPPNPFSLFCDNWHVALPCFSTKEKSIFVVQWYVCKNGKTGKTAQRKRETLASVHKNSHACTMLSGDEFNDQKIVLCGVHQKRQVCILNWRLDKTLRQCHFCSQLISKWWSGDDPKLSQVWVQGLVWGDRRCWLL